jgi:hypothetical protein
MRRVLTHLTMRMTPLTIKALQLTILLTRTFIDHLRLSQEHQHFPAHVPGFIIQISQASDNQEDLITLGS